MSDIDKVIIGAHTTFKIGAYVTAKGAGSLVDVGHTIDGVRFMASVEHKLIETDAHLTPGRAVPIKREYELKIPMLEATLENLRVALGQPSANKTGTPPNETLVVDADAAEQYHQIELLEPGLGTTAKRTVTAWKAFLKGVEEMVTHKGEERKLIATFGLLYEETGTGSDTIIKVVQS